MENVHRPQVGKAEEKSFLTVLTLAVTIRAVRRGCTGFPLEGSRKRIETAIAMKI